MSRGVQNVRRAIKQRKRMRGLNISESKSKQQLPMIQEEEKHGFPTPPMYGGTSFTIKEKRGVRSSGVALKAFISMLLFMSIAFIMSSNLESLSPTKNWLTKQLQNDFPFAKVSEWYETTFGAPLSIAPQGSITVDQDQEPFALPVMGHVVETFQVNGTGIKISPEDVSPVTTVDQGVVIFAGKDSETEKTVTVQHADGSNTTYGYLSSIDVHLYENIQANQTIGSFSPTEESEVVYFSIEKNNQFIDPSQVIPVDDIP